MADQSELLTTNRKALTINLDQSKYGTFAEIGAGQEVARHFFQAGGAAGTIAKTISAYDMTFSDAIYGKATRYVSRDRLEHMLDHEFGLLRERLDAQRGERSTFFVFADTVATKSYKNHSDGHGWMGMRFQTEPGGPANDIIMHVRMWDKESLLQQQTLGIAGVNLVHAAFFYRDDPRKFIVSLLDNIGADRLEVDMLTFSGPAFANVDNRVLSLHLVEYGLTNAVLFGPEGIVLQPSEAFYKKAILVERGSFRPVTHVHMDMLGTAAAMFAQESGVQGQETMVVAEITINNLLCRGGEVDAQEFLARADTLGALGFPVLVSNYSEFYRLTTYFRRYTKEMIGVALGLNTLLEVFNERYYENLDGGILESFGRLFRHAVKLYVYPMRAATFERLVNQTAAAVGTTAKPASTLIAAQDFAANILISARSLQVASHLRSLYSHLLENHFIEPVVGYDETVLDIFSTDVLGKLQAGDATWEKLVPTKAAAVIKERKLFGLATASEITAPA